MIKATKSIKPLSMGLRIHLELRVDGGIYAVIGQPGFPSKTRIGTWEGMTLDTWAEVLEHENWKVTRTPAKETTDHG